jgi:hypothetical protein
MLQDFITIKPGDHFKMKQAISKIEKDCTAGLNDIKPDRVFGMPTEQDG